MSIDRRIWRAAALATLVVAIALAATPFARGLSQQNGGPQAGPTCRLLYRLPASEVDYFLRRAGSSLQGRLARIGESVRGVHITGNQLTMEINGGCPTRAFAATVFPNDGLYEIRGVASGVCGHARRGRGSAASSWPGSSPPGCYALGATSSFGGFQGEGSCRGAGGYRLIIRLIPQQSQDSARRSAVGIMTRPYPQNRIGLLIEDRVAATVAADAVAKDPGTLLFEPALGAERTLELAALLVSSDFVVPGHLELHGSPRSDREAATRIPACRA